MNQNIMYWGTIYIAFFVVTIYNILIAKKFHISRWKILVITMFFFVFNWGISYLTAFVEAGFQAPSSANGVRAWVYVPFYLSAAAFLFRIDFRRLCDALTPCLIFGFALGHVGCVFTGCCYGYPYDGFGAIYNDNTGCTLFPIQLVESFFALLLFLAYVIYVLKSKYKVTGRQYPIMLIAYMGRIVFEFFRDNEKIWSGVSVLSLHSLFGGLVGILWLFFTTVKGKECAARIKNVMLKIIGKEPIPVLKKWEYKQQIAEMQHSLTHPKQVEIPENELLYAEKLDNQSFNKATRKTTVYVSSVIVISSIVFIFCVLYLTLLNSVMMATILVSIFAFFSGFLILYSSVQLFYFVRNCRIAKEKAAAPVLFRKPDEDIWWLLYGNAAYMVYFAECPNCDHKLKVSAVSKSKIDVVCCGKEKHRLTTPMCRLLQKNKK